MSPPRAIHRASFAGAVACVACCGRSSPGRAPPPAPAPASADRVALARAEAPGPAVDAAPASGDDALAVLDADRRTTWNPGVVGGIPSRTTVCATVRPPAAGDASAAIQAALDACPPGQVVQLSAGTFTIDDNYLLVRKGITLRGAGPTKTILQRTNGAKPGSYVAKVSDPIIVVGPNRWPGPDEHSARNLTSDAVKGSFSVTVDDAAGFASGRFVLLDEDDYRTGSWKALPNRGGAPAKAAIWATDRVVWQKHDPPDPADDPFPAALTWFGRSGRPISEIKEIASVHGNTVTFTTPIHIRYRTSHAAQLTAYAPGDAHVKGAGVEDLAVVGGADGNVRFECAAYSWMKRVDDRGWLGDGVSIGNSFRVEVRESYIHDGAWPEPGGGGYAISLSNGTSEVLVEDDIVMQVNKVMVVREAGAGSVIGYNYMDDGHILTSPRWQEVGLNASHMAGSHHVLFEGNESFNYDADCTHGNAIYHTIFRNHLSGFRRDYDDDPTSGNVRAAGLEYGAWWHSFIGNVLGTEGKTSGWQYEDPGDAPGASPWRGGRFVWKLGYDPAHWEQAFDPLVRSTVLRDGNFDYVTGRVRWAPGARPGALPASLYLKEKPAFFRRGRGYVWPWVDPTGPRHLYELPARARYDAGTPFEQP